MFKDELFSGSGPITVWINSPGGDCIAASQIYTILMDYKGDVTVKIDGVAAMAGTKVLIAPTALMMMEGFLNTHRNDMGVLSAEDDATYSKMEAELDALTNEVKRMERRDAHEAELNKPMSEPLTAAPEKTAQMDRKSGRASDAYKEDFGRHLRGKALLHNVLSTSPDVDGGFLVPTDFEHNIVTALDEENVIRRLAKVITTHHERKIPVAVGHSTAQWTAENAAYTESNPTFGQKQIDAFKLTDLCRVSVELLQDAEFDIEDYLIREFARAFGIAEETVRSSVQQHGVR